MGTAPPAVPILHFLPLACIMLAKMPFPAPTMPLETIATGGVMVWYLAFHLPFTITARRKASKRNTMPIA